MPRARPPQRRPAPRAARPRPRAAASPSAAETRLLRLAGDLAALGREGGLPAVLTALAAAQAPPAPLSRDVFPAWLRSRRDKTEALALAWAREQVRLAVQEALEAAPRRGRIDAPPDTLAWLLLAACEAVAHEPPSAAADRLRALLELTGHDAPA